MTTVGAFILTFLIQSAANGDITSFTQVHSTKATCEIAKEDIRQKLASGKVLLATCNPQ